MNKSESKYFHTAARFDQALISLLEKKPFEYITVSEICKVAGVNRSTFYLHYETMQDLLSETTRYVLESFASYFAVNEKSITEKFLSGDLRELVFINERYLMPYLAFIRDHQRLFTAAVSQPKIFQFDTAYRRLFERILDPVLDRFHYPPEERKFAMMFYLKGISAIVMEWIREGCIKSDENIAVIIQHCIFGAWNPVEIERIRKPKVYERTDENVENSVE